MDCLKVGDKVQVFTKQGINLEPVVTFIHRQPELMQEDHNLEKEEVLADN